MRGVLGLQVFANGLGLTMILLYVWVLFPANSGAKASALNLRVFGVYLAVNLLLGLPVNLVLLRRAVAWVREGYDASDRQRWLVLRLPLLETLTALVSWIGAAVLFGLLNTESRRVSVGIAFAGIVTCTLLYLLLESHFRPVYALALRGQDLPENRRDLLPRLMLTWLLGSGLPIALLGVAPLLDDNFDVDRMPWIAAFGFLGGGLVMVATAVSVGRPLNRVRDVLREVERGELDIELPVDDVGELGRLAEGVNDLVAGLREREQLRDLFGRQVGQVELAVPGAVADVSDMRSERVEITAMFVDLRGYTAYSEQHTPEEVVTMLNRFFRAVVAAVNREGGWVNKFEGDAALCVFGAPRPDIDHAAHALAAASSLRKDLARMEDLLPAGVGVSSGPAIAGYIGTPERFEYTVIGNCVNIASRLCDLSKDERSGVLATRETWDHAGRPDPWTDAGRVRVRGRSQRVAAVTLPAPRFRRN